MILTSDNALSVSEQKQKENDYDSKLNKISFARIDSLLDRCIDSHYKYINSHLAAVIRRLVIFFYGLCKKNNL